MNRSAKFLIGTCLMVFGVYAFLQYWHPTVVINYRLTIDAVTPDGAKSGSGIIQVSYASQFNLNGGGRSGVIKVTGEAVPVDLGQGKMLFVTLTCQASGRGCNSVGLDTAHDAEWLPVRVFGFDWNWGDERALARQVAAAKSAGPREVPLQALPTIVTFKDVNDPKSVVLIQPDNLAASFGEDYSLSKAALELTDDSTTQKIGTILVWLERLAASHARLNGNNGIVISNNELSNNLGSGEFIRRGIK
jgi:hypothetical protein